MLGIEQLVEYMACLTADAAFDGAYVIDKGLTEANAEMKRRHASPDGPGHVDVACLDYNRTHSVLDVWRLRSLDYFAKAKVLPRHGFTPTLPAYEYVRSMIGSNGEMPRRLKGLIVWRKDRLHGVTIDDREISYVDDAFRTDHVRKSRWAVRLNFPGLPGLRFVTDPTGIKAMLKDRDVPEGRSRRAALKHWVAAHWRRLRSDPEAETEVRLHLRGADAFTWLGMHGRIEVPASDHGKVLAARLVRQEHRRLGTDRRLRDLRGLL